MAGRLGGSVLLSTESLSLTLFNGGYALANVVLRLRGTDADGHEVYSIEQSVEALPRDDEVMMEIPSYELPAPAQSMVISLVSAEYGPEG